MIPPGAFGGGKPPPAPRVVNTDFFKGKVKSIYEREPLFQVMIFFQNIFKFKNLISNISRSSYLTSYLTFPF